MKILITGGAGFIGSNFIHYVLKRNPDWYIVNLDKLTYAGNLDNLRDIEHSVQHEFIRGSIENRELVNYLFSLHKFDVVINFAAESHVDRSIKDATVFIETNIKGTQILLDACREHGIDKFLQVSTDEVYGSLGPQEEAFTEENHLQPNSPYSASKAAADLLVRSYHNTYGLPTVITRCSNNYGPYQFPEKLIPLIIINALEDKTLPVYGDGKNIRDWIHVEDHCRALELVVLKGVSGEAYNVGADCQLKNIEVVKMILHVLKKPESLITFVIDRAGHDARYAVDASKIKAQLGWLPHYNFRDYLPKLVQWYRENGKWWRKIKQGG